MSSCPENFSQNADDRPRSADRTRSPAAVFQKWEYFKYPPEQRRGQSPRGGPPSFLTSAAMLRRLPQRDGVNLMTARIVKETGRRVKRRGATPQADCRIRTARLSRLPSGPAFIIWSIPTKRSLADAAGKAGDADGGGGRHARQLAFETPAERFNACVASTG
jgi:hypothetical protein